MTESLTGSFPYLDQLLGGYFNQDWCLDADTPEEIVSSFIQSAHAANVWATIADIRRFLQYHPNADEAYRRIFPNEISSPKSGLSDGEWLRWLEQMLLRDAPKLPEADDWSWAEA